MTAVTRDAGIPHAASSLRVRALAQHMVRGRTDDAPWIRPALVLLTAMAAALYTWDLAISGYANTYYSAAALAASKSWSAFFFGSFDAANFITVDKPPASIWLMGLSVRLFGLSSWSVLLPQALAGVLTVTVLYVAVRRSFGPVAGLVAGAVMALTPAAVLIFRFNNPDALMTLLLVAGAWALMRSLERGGLRWTALAAAFVGFAFLTKYLEAYVVLPGFALVYAISANASLRRRVAGLLVAAATVVLASGSWVAIVQLIPAGSRPFIGGSTTGSPLDLIFGYDGLGRIFGSSGPGGGAGGGGFSGTPGLLRLFNDQLFGEIAWLIPLAVGSLVVGLWLRRHAGRRDPGVAGYLLWGSWFVVMALVFSFMSGVIHSYYAVSLAPAVGALVGGGLVDLWRVRSRTWLARLALGAAFIGSAAWEWQLLDRTPDFAPGLGAVGFGIASIAAAGLLFTAAPCLPRALARLSGTAAIIGMAAILLAPSAYAISTVGTAYSGGDPHPGPGTASGGMGGFTGGPGGGPAAFGTLPVGGAPPTDGTVPSALAGSGRAAPATGSALAGGPGGGGTTDSALVTYLVEHRGTATWIVAANSAQQAGTLELASGLPVMAMGGFTGSDPAPTLAQLKAYISSGQLRYVLADGGGGGFGGSGSTASERTSWVTSTCTLVDYGNTGSSSLYDCAGAA